jgi:hypothetical protein
MKVKIAQPQFITPEPMHLQPFPSAFLLLASGAGGRGKGGWGIDWRRAKGQGGAVAAGDAGDDCSSHSSALRWKVALRTCRLLLCQGETALHCPEPSCKSNIRYDRSEHTKNAPRGTPVCVH